MKYMPNANTKRAPTLPAVCELRIPDSKDSVIYHNNRKSTRNLPLEELGPPTIVVIAGDDELVVRELEREVVLEEPGEMLAGVPGESPG
jgi:hypothetical protein